MLPYERFEAWRACHRTVLAVYEASASWPVAERYGLVAQGRRAAISAAANIAEGSAKRGPAEFARFVDISLGSLSELAYILRVARDLGYLSAPQHVAVEATRAEAGLRTWRLYRRLRRPPP